MNMDEQPVDLLSLELAKKLKERGFNQPSQCYWICHVISPAYPEKWYISREGGFNKGFHPEYMPAYSTFELFEIVPQWIDTKENEPFNYFNFNLSINRIVTDDIVKRIYLINYNCDIYTIDQLSQLKLFKKNIYDEKLVDALGKALIQICNNKWIMGGLSKNDNC